MDKRILGILLAAGKSKRFGGEDKLLQDLLGKPVIYYPLLALENVEEISDIILVSDKEKRDLLRDFIGKWGFKKVKNIVEGGKERQDSVYNALKSVSSYDFVLIHDSARPLASEELVKRVIKEGLRKKAVVTGLPVKDTIKLVDSSGKVKETLPRERLWQIQTPQFFEFQLILEAHEKARKDNFYGTDDSILVERLNFPVYVIEGEPWNIKITTKEDLEVIRWWKQKGF
ncbi:MAG: 2-C-methyl-D-erythritol 4-phosphate cytidylyltransferase [Dictyoglomaceae bacterium]